MICDKNDGENQMNHTKKWKCQGWMKTGNNSKDYILIYYDGDKHNKQLGSVYDTW